MNFKKQHSDKPLVTVAILSYNYAHYIEQTLDSILNQTYENIELIIVDDCSKDNSVAVAKQWITKHDLDVHLILHEKNYGRNRACNNILDRAKGKYLLLFSSDDIMNPGRIEAQVNELEKVGEEYGVCFTDATLIHEDGTPYGMYYEMKQTPIIEGDVFEPYLKGEFTIPAPSILFRRNVFDVIGRYDERVTIEDVEMWMRLLPRYKVKYCSYVGLQYRTRLNTEVTEAFKIDDKIKYHNNRVLIYHNLYKLLQQLNKFQHLYSFIEKKINYHLIHAMLIRSPQFRTLVMMLLRNGFYKISFLRLLKLQVKSRISKQQLANAS